MDIIKIAAFAFIALFIVVIFKGSRDDIALQVSTVAGVVLFLFIILKLASVLSIIQSMAIKAGINYEYIVIVFKILGISYIASFCSEICRDAGSNNIASKVEFSGKVLILVIAIPILMAVMQSIIKIIQ